MVALSFSLLVQVLLSLSVGLTSALPVPDALVVRPHLSAAEKTEHFVNGLVDSGVDFAKGLVHLGFHPISTVKGAFNSVRHLPTTYHTLGEKIKDAYAKDPSNAAGYTVGTIALTLVPLGAVNSEHIADGFASALYRFTPSEATAISKLGAATTASQEAAAALLKASTPSDILLAEAAYKAAEVAKAAAAAKAAKALEAAAAAGAAGVAEVAAPVKGAAGVAEAAAPAAVAAKAPVAAAAKAPAPAAVAAKAPAAAAAKAPAPAAAAAKAPVPVAAPVTPDVAVPAAEAGVAAPAAGEAVAATTYSKEFVSAKIKALQADINIAKADLSKTSWEQFGTTRPSKFAKDTPNYIAVAEKAAAVEAATKALSEFRAANPTWLYTIGKGAGKVGSFVYIPFKYSSRGLSWVGRKSYAAGAKVVGWTKSGLAYTKANTWDRIPGAQTYISTPISNGFNKVTTFLGKNGVAALQGSTVPIIQRNGAQLSN